MRRPPQYRLHKPSQLAVVTLQGKDHYLGRFNSPESWQNYHKLLLERAHESPRGQCSTLAVSADSSMLTVNELILHYWQFAQTYYLRDGQPTTELDCMRHALGFPRRVHGRTRAVLFGPKALKAVRETMISHPIMRRRVQPTTGRMERQIVAQGLTRKVINRHIGRIKRVIAWAVEEELLPASIYEALRCVRGLRRGRTAARERQPVRPILEAQIQALLPQLPFLVATMVQIHRLCGCRSQDLVQMRGMDIDQAEPIWEYRPARYKTMHLNDDDDPDQDRIINLGPRAQDLLRPLMLEDSQAYVFSPQRSEELRRAELRTYRKTPLYPSHLERYQRKKLKTTHLRQCYDDNSYRRAVQRACKKAGVPLWSPKRLRHTRLTEIRRLHGLEASKACAGHREIGVTQHYAEQDRNLAKKVMAELG